MLIDDDFDKTFIINLPQRTDRRREMLRELEAIGVAPTPGRVEFFPGVRPDDRGEFPSVGARGGFLSHVAVLRRARAEGAASVLMLEDDLSFSRRFGDLEAAVAAELRRREWDIVYLGHPLELPTTAAGPLIPHAGPIMLTHFCGIHGRVFDRLIGFLEAVNSRPAGHPEGGPMYSDAAFSTFRAQNPDVVTLVCVPSLGWQRSSRSDIAPGRWFERVPALRWLVQPLRTVKSRLIRR